MSRILAAGAARMKLEAENYEARIAALEAQLAELAAENERLTADRDFWKERFQVETRARIKALASTGAVKALPRPDTVSMSGGAICLEYADYDLRDAAYDWLEAHGAGGELEPHPRATNTVDAHETANVSDKPEGQQEPVAIKAAMEAGDER